MRRCTWIVAFVCLALCLHPVVGQQGEGRIAFYSNRDGNDEIYVMNAGGSGVRNLTNNPTGDLVPAWSPDGSKIAFWSYRDGAWDIYVMNADGSEVRNVSNSASVDKLPAWSPDGTQIAFRSNRDGNWEIYVVNVDGSGLRNLTNNPAYEVAPAWSPEGGKIAFVSSPRGRPAQVYLVNADGSGKRQLTNNPGTVGEKVQTVSLSQLAWSPDGSKIALRAGDLDGVYTNIASVSVDTGELQLLTSGVDRHGKPRWSPDSTQIAYDRRREGNFDIYVMSAEGELRDDTGRRRLTRHPSYDWFPVWSPNGSQIAFASERDGNSEIYVVNADGSGLRNLTNSSSDDHWAAWRPHP